MFVQPQGPEDETKGIEMEQDFDGEMQDVPENPDANEDDPEEEGDDDRLDQEMGEGEEDDEVVDEKLWGEDEERPNDPDAKTEKDAPMKVHPLINCEGCAAVDPSRGGLHNLYHLRIRAEFLIMYVIVVSCKDVEQAVWCATIPI